MVNFSARFIYDESTLDENCCGVATAVVGPTAGIVNALGGQIPTPVDPFSLETAVNSPTQNEIDDRGASLQLDWNFDFLGGATLTSITAYRENSYDFNSDSDFTSLELLEDTFQFVDIDTFTQEFRLTSDNDGPLAWMLGGFYLDETIDQESGIDFGADLRSYIDALASIDTDATSPTFGVPLTFVSGPTASPLFGIEQAFGFAPNTFFGDDVRLEETFNQENDSFSIFGTIDFDVTDRLTITVGGNYTEDNKDVTAFTVNNDAFSDLTLTGAQGVALVLPDVTAGVEAGVAQQVADALFADGDAATMTPSFEQALGIPFTPENLASAEAGDFGAAAQGFVAQIRTGAAAAAVPIAADIAPGVAADLVAGPDSPLAGLLALQFQPQFLAFPNAIEDGRTRDRDFSYTVRAAYEVNDNLNVYFSHGTGFKASSFNLTRDSRPFLSDAAALQEAGLLPNNFTPETGRNFGTRFSGPEDVRIFEAGLKTRFDFGSINVAVFDQTIENFQSTSIWQDPEFDDFQGAPVVTGGEIDLADGVADGIGDLSGQQPAGINELAISLSAQYEHSFGDSFDAYIRGDWQFEDEVQVVNNIGGLNRDTSIFNGAIGFTFDEDLDLRFWGRNIFNHETFTSAFPGVIQAGTVNAYPNQPRTYGASLRKTF